MTRALLWVLLFPQASGELKPGLVGEYFDVGRPLHDFPATDDLRPLVRRVDPEISFGPTVAGAENFAGTGLEDRFYVRWTGRLHVPARGRYVFTLGSDDGSRLYLDGRLLVDNGGVHAFLEAAATVELEPGLYDLKVEYFDNDGIAACELTWQGPGFVRTVIPPGALLHESP